MRPRIKRESNIPSSVRVYYTNAQGEELKALKERARIFKEHDEIVKAKKEPSKGTPYYAITMFNRTHYFPEDIAKASGYKYEIIYK